MWNTIKKYVTTGKKVIFIGPPAQYTTDGEEIGKEFAELTGIEFSETESAKIYNSNYEYDTGDIWFTTQKIEMSYYPVVPTDAEVLIKNGKEIIGVHKKNVEYYSFELPLTVYFETLLSQLEEYTPINFPSGIVSKISHDGDMTIITLTGYSLMK
jgi:hypothetical protein